MHSNQPRVAIIGGGIMGVMAAWRLAAHGATVDLFERGWIGNPSGSSAGETRMFRRIYAEGSAYEGFLARSLTLWGELNRDPGAPVLTPSGGVIIAPGTHPLITSSIAHADAHDLPYEVLDPDAAGQRFPHLTLDPTESLLHDPGAGVLRSSIALVRAARRAASLGARIREGVTVEAVDRTPSGVTLHFALHSAGGDLPERASYDHVVIAAGMRAPALLPELQFVRRWFFHTWHPLVDQALSDRFPLVMRRHPQSSFGAMNALDGSTIKISPHLAHNELVGELDDLRGRAAEFAQISARTVAASFTGVDTAAIRLDTYAELYTPDGHPYLGGDDRVSVMTAFSGHGFKAAPGFADALALRILERPGAPELPELLSPARPREALVDIRSVGIPGGAVTA